MKKIFTFFIILLFLSSFVFSVDFSYAKGRSRSSRSYSSGHSHKGYSSSHSYKGSAGHKSSKAVGVKRDHHGKIARNPRQRQAFMKQHPCPSTGKASGKCPGYVVDHIVPLKRGGADRPSNMQWQTKQQAKLKDKYE